MRREEVIRKIVERDLRQQGLTKKTVCREAAELHTAACEHFGTWDTALHYAGINWRRMTKRTEYTPDRALAKLRCICLRGYNLSSQRNRLRDRPLYEAVCKYFGTWEQALCVVGLHLENAHDGASIPRLDEQEILAAIRERRQAGLSLTWSTACLENRDLVMAAKAAFRSWPRAIAAAGLVPDQPHVFGRLRWTKKRVLEAIKRRHHEGKSLNRKEASKEDGALVAAAQRYVNSWSDALKQAGLVDD